jgi:hypothetical protein
VERRSFLAATPAAEQERESSLARTPKVNASEAVELLTKTFAPSIER